MNRNVFSPSQLCFYSDTHMLLFYKDVHIFFLISIRLVFRYCLLVLLSNSRVQNHAKFNLNDM